MRPSTPPLLVIAWACALVAPPAAAAQTIPSPFTFIERRQEAGVSVGYASTETGRFGLGPSGGVLLGGRYAVELSGPLSLEGHVGVISGTRDIVNPARLEGEQIVGQGDVLLTTIDARLRFTLTGDRAWRGLAPFLALGGGVAFDAAADPEIEADLEPADVFDFGSSFVGTVGAGTRWFLTDALALRLEGLFTLWSIDTPPGFSDPTRGFSNVDESEWMGGLSLSATLLYRW